MSSLAPAGALDVVVGPGRTVRVTVEGAGTPLLYLHGLSSFASTARREAPTGFRLATFDQRGHGEGPAFDAPADYSVDAFVGDAIVVLDALAAAEPKSGWEQPLLGGTSMGSAVALRLALNHPGRVRGLALAGPAFGDELNPLAETIAPAADKIEQLGLRAALPHLEAAQLERGVPPEGIWQIQRWVNHDETVFPTVLRTVSHWIPFPDLGVVAELEVPVGLVAWPDDPVHPFELAQRLAIACPAPTAMLASVGRVLAEPESVARAFGLVAPHWAASNWNAP